METFSVPFFDFMDLRQRRLFREEEREYRKVQRKIKEKDVGWLGRWLEKFSVEGDFWSKKKREKLRKNDWL